MRRWIATLSVCVLSVGVLSAASARPKNNEAEAAARAATDRVPAASASEIPALAALLAKAGWTPTPELSGVFKAGSIFGMTGLGHSLISSSCITGKPEESTYTAAELVTSLQAGVSVGGPLASGGAYAGIVKKVKFGTPVQVTIPRLGMKLSPECQDDLKSLPMSEISNAYVVQEVLKAEISEQTCGKVDARGSFVGLGSAEAEYASACAQASLEPVAVGYRTVPLAGMLGLTIAESVPEKSGGAKAGSGVKGGGFNTSGTLAQIQAAKDLEARLNAELDTCLDKQEEDILTQASQDAASLAPLLDEPGAKAKELGGPEVKRYIDLYGSAEAKCTNDLGERSRPVSVSAVAAMSAWLEKPGAGSGVPRGTWTGPSGYTMMVVPAGTFEVGCTASYEICMRWETPAYTVKLGASTLIGKTEVTQELYQSVMKSTPWTGEMIYYKQKRRSCIGGGVGSILPAHCVSWIDAAKFANALSERDGLEACYTIKKDTVSWPKGLSCTGYRLPTEAEWEVAARGGRESLYAGGAEPTAVGWIGENSKEHAHPVGQKAANGYGLHDMTGNVSEWTWDSRDASSDSPRIFKGGSWKDSVGYCRMAGSTAMYPAYRSDQIGIRLARTLP